MVIEWWSFPVFTQHNLRDNFDLVIVALCINLYGCTDTDRNTCTVPNTFLILIHGHSVLTQYSKIAFKPNELCTSRASVAQCLVVIIGSLFKCLNSYSSLEEF